METDLEPIVIVTGIPRSGTSLMMQMLVAGGLQALTDDARLPSADNPRGYYEYEPVKRLRDDASWVTSAGGKVVKVIHALLPHLPGDCRYRIVFMRRDLREVVASQRRMIERAGATGATLTERQLIAAYEGQLVKTHAWIRDQPNVEVVEVDYNELVRDPGASIEAIDRFLGGGLDLAAMATVVDPTLHRERA